MYAEGAAGSRKGALACILAPWLPYRTMHTSTSFERRESLADHDLERLRLALVDEVDRYLVAIRGYEPEKMDRHGKHYLADLQERVAVVERLQRSRKMR